GGGGAAAPPRAGGAGLARPGRIPGHPPAAGRPVIRGTVTANREPVVRLRVRGPGGAVADVDLVVDTGFTGALVLPAAVVAALGLPWRSGGTAVLADGSTHQTGYYEAGLGGGPGGRAVPPISVGPPALPGR